MTTGSARLGRTVNTTVDCDEILALYKAGQYLTAYNRLEQCGGLDALAGSAGRALAGRLAANLGGERYGRAIHLRAWRQAPDAESLGFCVAMAIAHLRGPVAALRFAEGLPRDHLTPIARADILSVEAFLLTAVRDFDHAERALREAFELAPDHLWLLVVRSQVEAAQDRTCDALASQQEALRKQARFRPAIQALAETLARLDRVEEARTLLAGAAQRLESGLILLQLVQLERELEQYESARGWLRAAKPLLPLRQWDRTFHQMWTGLEATLEYDCGDIDQAIALAREADTPFQRSIAENLSKHGRTGKRVVLNVGFTLQHDATCVPATLSTLSRYWSAPVEQLEIAEAICYDGTPAHAERQWLERQQFVCREFTLTWEAARRLIDAGLPFTHTLVGYRVAHMQAVIGYDSRRGVLIIRDPNVRQAGEILAQELIEQMRSSGPRGMVFVPSRERQRLEAIELPEHQLWDAHYELSLRLAEHDRNGAWKAYQQMVDTASGHRLTVYAMARIASYDGDWHTLQECTEKLLAEFPDDQNQWSVKLNLLREIGTRSQRLKVLKELNAKRDCEAVFRHQYVEELLDDPRQRDEVRRLLRRQLCSGAVDGQTFSLVARHLWVEDDRSEALRWMRYAACLDDKDETRAMAYFSAARVLNSTDDALEMLQSRFDRFHTRSGGPGRSLAEAFDQLYRPQVAVDVLEQALAARPHDSWLRLSASEFLMRIGRHAGARRYLEESRASCRAADWHAMAARLELCENRLEEALDHARKSLHADPLNLATQRLAAEVLADLRGTVVALEHLKEYSAQFPEHHGLRALLVERAGELGPEASETEVRALLALHPHDAWAWRELGFSLVQQRRWQDAYDAAKRAHQLEPHVEALYFLFGQVFRGVGKHDKAVQALLRAIQLCADYPHAILELVRLCDTLAERRQVLGKVLGELKRQVIRGDSLRLFREQAAITFEPAEVLRMLLEARKARPDLWQTWSVLVRQLLAMKRLDDALKFAQAAAQRFPLLPQTLVDLADVYLQFGKSAEERATLDRALAIDSRNGEVLRRSAEAYARAGKVEKQRATLQRACASEPRNVTHLGALAELLWSQGERAEAIETIRAAIQREPAYEWGWQQLSTWVWTVGEPGQMVEMASEITTTRPNSPNMWLQRARILAQFPEHYGDCQQAIKRAIELDPQSVDAHELQAILLAEHGEFEASLEACHPKTLGLGGRKPLQLATRAAVIEYQRGKRGAAIDQMRHIIEQDPHYWFAWSKLAEWLPEDGKLDEALQCARRLTEVAPDAAVSWGYTAHCLLALDEREEAIRHLQKAVQLDPSYQFGGQVLLSLQLDDKQFDAAIDTLRIIGPHLAEEERYAKQARVNCLAGKLPEALQAFQTACGAKLNGTTNLLDAADALLQAGQAGAVKESLLAVLEQPDCSSELSQVVIEIFAREGSLSAIEELLETLDPAGEVWAEATAAYAEVLGQAGAISKLVWLISQYEVPLRRHNVSWAAVGSALQRIGLYEEVRTWMYDWQQRSDLTPNMLAPLAVSLVVLNEGDLAANVARLAERLPISPATDTLRLLGACAEIVQDNPSAAGNWLSSIHVANLPPNYASLFAVADCACGLAWELARGARWKAIYQQWSRSLSGHVAAATDEFAGKVVSHCELLLGRRRSAVNRWLAEGSARRTERRRRRCRQVRQRRFALLLSAAPGRSDGRGQRKSRATAKVTALLTKRN